MLGKEDGKNSIGKSTLLLVIDFAFGGEDFALSDDIRLNVGECEIFFTFLFEEKRFYFCRSNNAKNIVWECDSSKNKIKTITLEDYKNMLNNFYNLNELGTTFRDAVGLYSRIYGKDNLNPVKPLHVVQEDKFSNAINSLLRLFGLYPQIKEYEQKANESQKKFVTFKNANKFGLLNSSLIIKTEYEKNKTKISELKKKITEVRKEIEGSNCSLDSILSDEALSLKDKIVYTKRLKAKSKIKLRKIESNLSNKFSKSEKDFEQLLKYFPNTNVKRLEEVENFHFLISRIFKQEMKLQLEETNKEINEYESLLSDYLTKFNDLTNFSSPITGAVNEYLRLSNSIESISSENKVYEIYHNLKDDNDKMHEDLKEIKSALLSRLSSQINSKIENIDASIYGNNYSHPKLLFDKSSYTFSTKNDTGTGVSFKGIIVFDISILGLTKLPFFIHDTPLFKQIEDDVIERILACYSNFDKQIFIAFDKQNSYSENVRNILDNKKVIKLGDGAQSLFGKIWSKVENN
ncbi:MAG: DUF2326 domain-containing protein [Bacilli bacterium]|nr:DUF2326 domain-containing protein [Bacilli bacterium]